MLEQSQFRWLRLIPGLVLGSALAMTVGSVQVQAQGNLKIGVIGPLTGAASSWGIPSRQGALLAAEEINAAGGIGGKQIEIIDADDACVPATGITAAQRLITRDQVQIIFGAVCSSVTLALMPVAEQNKVLLLNSTSSNPKITYEAGVAGKKYTFRNIGTDETRAAVTLKYAVEKLGRKKFSAIGADNDYGRDGVAYAKKYMKDHPGVTLVSEDYFPITETDFRSVLTKIKANKADAIIYFGIVGTSPIICTQMNELGMGGGSFPLIGYGDFTPEVIAKCPAGSLQNTVETVGWIDSVDAPGNVSFIEKYKKRWKNEEPVLQSYNNWATMYILRDAVAAAKSTKNEDIIAALEKGKFSTPMGTISFDDHHQSDMPMIVIEIIDGKRQIRGLYRSEISYPK